MPSSSSSASRSTALQQVLQLSHPSSSSSPPSFSSSPSDSGPSSSSPEDDNTVSVPPLSPLGIFTLFLQFGLRAWGGPFAQIAMIKEQLVVQEKWITVARFNRVLAVYQVLPGPEATELCCYFGMLAGGRLGSVLGGLGFILPGFLLMLLCAWLYTMYGVQSAAVQASFAALQPTVAAMVVRAVHKIGDHAVQVRG